MKGRLINKKTGVREFSNELPRRFSTALFTPEFQFYSSRDVESRDYDISKAKKN